MSRETIVNRVKPSFGLEIETERLRQELSVDTQVHYQGQETTIGALPEGAVPDETVEQILKTTEQPFVAPAQTAEAIRAGQVGQAQIDAEQELRLAIPAIIEIAKAGLTRDPDLEFFKNQVVTAFKHLGLDTRKFFGV